MLTRRQQEILAFITDQMRHRKIPPTVRDIQRRFGFKSVRSASCHLDALEAKGAITRESGTARGLFPAEEVAWDSIPIYGQIPAGLPSAQTQGDEGTVRIDVASLGLPPSSRLFALKARGDSMIGAGILDGDIVLLERREPREGEVIAALVDGQTTLKRYIRKRGRPCLKAENPNYSEIRPVEELVCQGVMRALIRKT